MADCTRSAVSRLVLSSLGVLFYSAISVFPKDPVYRLRASDPWLGHLLCVAFKWQSCVCAQPSTCAQLAPIMIQIKRWETLRCVKQDQTLEPLLAKGQLDLAFRLTLINPHKQNTKSSSSSLLLIFNSQEVLPKNPNPSTLWQNPKLCHFVLDLCMARWAWAGLGLLPFHRADTWQFFPVPTYFCCLPEAKYR